MLPAVQECHSCCARRVAHRKLDEHFLTMQTVGYKTTMLSHPPFSSIRQAGSSYEPVLADPLYPTGGL